MDRVNHQQPVRDTWRGSCVAYVDGFEENSTITVSAPGLRSGTAVPASRGLDRAEADCEQNGWIPVSMRDEWWTIYGPQVERN